MLFEIKAINNELIIQIHKNNPAKLGNRKTSYLFKTISYNFGQMYNNCTYFLVSFILDIVLQIVITTYPFYKQSKLFG